MNKEETKEPGRLISLRNYTLCTLQAAEKLPSWAKPKKVLRAERYFLQLVKIDQRYGHPGREIQ